MASMDLDTVQSIISSSTMFLLLLCYAGMALLSSTLSYFSPVDYADLNCFSNFSIVFWRSSRVFELSMELVEVTVVLSLLVN